MKFLKLSFVVILLPFCSNMKSKPTTLSVCNKTENTIDSIKISSYGVNLMFKDLLKNDIKIKHVNINIPANAEGAFTINIFQKDSVVYSGSFGYFSNEYAIKEKYKINILKNYSIQEEPDN